MYTSKTTAAAALVMSALVSSSANASSVTLDAVGISPFENAQGKRAWVIQTSFDLGAESVLLRDVGMYRLEATREDGSVQRLRAVTAISKSRAIPRHQTAPKILRRVGLKASLQVYGSPPQMNSTSYHQATAPTF